MKSFPVRKQYFNWNPDLQNKKIGYEGNREHPKSAGRLQKNRARHSRRMLWGEQDSRRSRILKQGMQTRRLPDREKVIENKV